MTSSNPFDSLQRNRRRSSLAVRIPLFIFLVLVVAAVVYWRSTMAGLFWRAFSPVAQLRNRVEQNNVSTLEAQLASTTAALADRNALAQENATLKRLLGRPGVGTQVVGAVIMRPPGLPYDTLMIDIGSNNGVIVGNLVFGGGTLAIGDITDVYPTTARVTLFSAPGRTYDAQVVSTKTLGTALPVSLQGQGAGSFTGQVPAGSTVGVGDSVLIPGLSAFMGTISHVDAPSNSSFETLYMQLPVNIFSLQYVEVQTHI